MDGGKWSVNHLNVCSAPSASAFFFDRTCYAALDRIASRPYAALICAGSDGQNAARQVECICTGWRLRLLSFPGDPTLD